MFECLWGRTLGNLGTLVAGLSLFPPGNDAKGMTWRGEGTGVSA